MEVNRDRDSSGDSGDDFTLGVFADVRNLRRAPRSKQVQRSRINSKNF